MKVERINKAVVTYSWSEFFAFLEKHGAFLKYMKNLEQYKETLPEKTIAEWMESCAPKDWLRGAFVWSKTPEGHLFWNVLDADWVAEVRKVEDRVASVEKVEWVLLK